MYCSADHSRVEVWCSAQRSLFWRSGDWKSASACHSIYSACVCVVGEGVCEQTYMYRYICLHIYCSADRLQVVRPGARHRGAFFEHVVTGNLLMLVIPFIYSACVCVCVCGLGGWGWGVGGGGYVSKHTCIQVMSTYILLCWSLAGCEDRCSVQRCLFQRSGDWESPNTHLLFICGCVNTCMRVHGMVVCVCACTCVCVCRHVCGWGGGGGGQGMCANIHTYMSTYIAVLIIHGLWSQTLSIEEPFFEGVVTGYLLMSFLFIYSVGVLFVVCVCVCMCGWVRVLLYCVYTHVFAHVLGEGYVCNDTNT